MVKVSDAFYKGRGGLNLALPLGTQVVIGSIGYMDRTNAWVEVSTVFEMFGFNLTVRPKRSASPKSFSLTSGNSVSFRSFANGETSALFSDTAKAKARAEVNLSTKGSFLMSVHDQRVTRAVKLGRIFSKIRQRYHRPPEDPSLSWQKNYAVVWGVASARSVSIAMATGSGAQLAIEAETPAQTPTSVADLAAGMTVFYQSESIEKIWAAPAVEYAFQAFRLSPSMFRKWDDTKFVPVGGPRLLRGARAQQDEIVRVELVGPLGAATRTRLARDLD